MDSLIGRAAVDGHRHHDPDDENNPAADDVPITWASVAFRSERSGGAFVVGIA
jgi:hypothetical protein